MSNTKGMSPKEAIKLLMDGETIKFPVQYAGCLFIELERSKFDKKFAGVIENGQMAIYLIKDFNNN